MTVGAPTKQTVGSSGGTTAANQNISCTSTAGNTLLLVYARSGGLAIGAVTSVTDTGGNTWEAAATTRGAVSGVSNTRLEFWLCKNAASPGTITVNSATAQTNSWTVLEWAGLLLSGPVDVASPDNSSAASSTSISSPNLTGLTGTADLVVAAAHFSQTTAALAAGSPYTALTNFDDAAAGSGRAAYQVLSASGSVNGATWSPLGVARAAGVLTVALFAAASSQTAAVPITGGAAMSVTGADTATASLPMTGSAAVAVTGTDTTLGSLPITGSATVGVGGAGTLASSLPMTGSANMSVTPATGTVTPGTAVTSANGNTQTNTSLSVAFPAAAVDTLMVVEISGDASGTGVAPTGMAAAGWTKLGEAIDTNTGTATSSSYTGVFWKTIAAGGASGSASFTWTNAGQMCAICTPYTNYDPVTPAVWIAGQEKLTSDTAYSVAGTTTDAGLLVTAFADRAGSTAFSALSDNARATAIVGTTGSIITGRVSASVVAAGTAFTKTATGTNTSVGTAVAYTIRGSVATDTASIPMTQSGTVGVAGTATGNTSIPMTQTGTMAANGLQTDSTALPMTQTGAVAISPATILATWLTKLPYYVAHRGGDNDWVEMTRDAYTHAIANGATAINIDAVRCSTGEFVASHDATTGRVFGTNLTIGSSTWTSLSGLTTTTGGFPIEKVADLLAAFPSVVVFVENKGNSSDDSAFLDMLDAAGGPGRIVVKQYYTAATVSTDAHARGYTTWGYYFTADVTNLASTQSRWDLLGLDYTDTNSADWTSIKSFGKKVLGHVIPSAAGATQAFSEGADGIMTGKILGVVPGNQQTASLPMTQTSTIAASPALTHPGAVAMAQTATIGLAGTQTGPGALAVVQGGAVALAGSGSITGTTAIAQTGVLALSPSVSGAVTIPITQASVLSVAGRQTTTGTIAIVQAGSVTLVGMQQLTSALPILQTATIGLVGADTTVAAVPINQTGTVSLVGQSTQTATAACAQSATLAVTGLQTTSTALALSQSGIVVVTGSAGSATSLPMQQTTTVTVVPAVARLGSIAITGTGLLSVIGTASAPVTAVVGMLQAAGLAFSGAVTEMPALPMTQLGAVGISANHLTVSTLNLTGSNVVTLVVLDQLIGSLALTGTGQLSLTGIDTVTSALAMVSISTLSVGAVEFTPPLDISALMLTGRADLSLTGVAMALAGLMIAQSSRMDIGAGVLTVRRHVRIAASMGIAPWSATATSFLPRWSASATVPVYRE